MTDRPLSVLVISPSDVGGGAEMIAADLASSCRDRGHTVRMAVGRKTTDDPEVFELTHDRYRDAWARLWLAIARKLGREKIRNIGEPLRWLRRLSGREDMDFPASARVLDLAGVPVDLVHANNLHGAGAGFFDLRALPTIASQVPLILTLHDAWLLAGHCAHSFDCERWRTGCGDCPDLTIPEAIRRDASAANHDFKRSVFQRCRIFLATPSAWLMNRARASLLADSIIESRVIPNGVDLSCFHPGDRVSDRCRLGLDGDAFVVLTVGNTVRANTWRDFDTAVAATRALAEAHPGRVVLAALGEAEGVTIDGDFELRFIAHLTDPHEVSAHYRAADVVVHSSRVDTFPTVVLEAMACGTPVVATSVGGIPEQVTDGVTGFLVAPGDVGETTRRLRAVAEDPGLGRRIGGAGTDRAAMHFGRELMVDRYLIWYLEIAQARRTIP